MTGLLAIPASSVPGAITPPSIEYGQLSPMLVVFGAAVAGILVEAFTPRAQRRTVQLVITLGSILAAFVLTTGFFYADVATCQPRYLPLFRGLLHPHWIW